MNAISLVQIFIGAIIANVTLWGLVLHDWRAAAHWILGNGAALTAVWIVQNWR